MDPIEIATLAISLLTPYIAKLGESMAEKVGQNIPQHLGNIWKLIEAKFKNKAITKEAMKDLLSKPDDPDNLAAFRKELRKALETDHKFALALIKLIQSNVSEADPKINVESGIGVFQGNFHGTINITKNERDTQVILGHKDVIRLKNLKELHHELQQLWKEFDMFWSMVNANIGNTDSDWNRITRHIKNLDDHIKAINHKEITGLLKELNQLHHDMKEKIQGPKIFWQPVRLKKFQKASLGLIFDFLNLVDQLLRNEAIALVTLVEKAEQKHNDTSRP